MEASGHPSFFGVRPPTVRVFPEPSWETLRRRGHPLSSKDSIAWPGRQKHTPSLFMCSPSCLGTCPFSPHIPPTPPPTYDPDPKVLLLSELERRLTTDCSPGCSLVLGSLCPYRLGASTGSPSCRGWNSVLLEGVKYRLNCYRSPKAQENEASDLGRELAFQSVRVSSLAKEGGATPGRQAHLKPAEE